MLEEGDCCVVVGVGQEVEVVAGAEVAGYATGLVHGDAIGGDDGRHLAEGIAGEVFGGLRAV